MGIDEVLAGSRDGVARLTPHQAAAAAQRGALLVSCRGKNFAGALDAHQGGDSNRAPEGRTSAQRCDDWAAKRDRSSSGDAPRSLAEW